MHGAMAEDMANLSELVDQRMARLDHKLQQLGQLQTEHHFVLNDALAQAPAANRHLGDLHRSLAERAGLEHVQLQESRQVAAEELKLLSKSAGELRQMVNEVIPATQKTSQRALENLAKLADQIQQEKTDFGSAMQAALHAHQEGQRWMVMTTAIGGALISALTTLGLVVGLRYIGWLQ